MVNLPPLRPLGAALIAVAMLSSCSPGRPAPTSSPPGPRVALPRHTIPDDARLADLLNARHSTREYRPEAISVDQLAALLWAGYGVQSDGGRTVPSAGGLYPMSLYVLAGDVTDLVAGIYRYDPDANELQRHRDGDQRAGLMSVALDQESIAAAPLVIIVAGAPDRLRDRYGDRAERFALLEAGHVGQNLALAAEGLDLGMVTIGAFDDAGVKRILDLPPAEQAYYLVPVGHPA